jgi:hypothetical protein
MDIPTVQVDVSDHFYRVECRSMYSICVRRVIIYSMNAREHSNILPVMRKMRLSEAPKDTQYWRTQPFTARLAALEQIRKEYHRWKYHAEPGLQRVYTIIKH